MALRNLKKSMKPLIAVFVVAFILTIVAGLFGSFGALTGGNYALKLNGKKVDIVKIEKAFQMVINNFTQQYGESVNVEELKLLIFNNIVEQELMLQAAKDLKVKVTAKEIEEQLTQIEGQFPDTATFESALQAQGLTKATLKIEIENNLKTTKVKEAIEAKVVITEEELKAYYEENKFNSYFVDKTYDSVKKDIEDSILTRKKGEALRSFIEKAQKTATYKFPKINKQENPYKAYQSVTAYEKEGFVFTNVDLANRKIMYRIQGMTDEAALDKMIKESIDKELKIVVKAKELGLKVDEALAKEDKIAAYREAYQKHLLATTKPTEEEMKAFFDKNAARYDKAENYDFNLVEFEIKAGPEDEAAAKAKIEQILKEALAEGADFGALAQKYSEDGSAANGGNLGWFAKGQMVKEFEEAAFAGEKGKVIPKVIKTEFGYHVVKVEDKKDDGSEVNASHIIVTFKVGQATVDAMKKKVETIASDIKANKTTFEKVAKDSLLPDTFEFKSIRKGEQIQGIGQVPELSEAIANATVGEVTSLVADRAFVFNKTKHTPFVKAEFAAVKDRVNYDLVREKVGLELSKMYE